jgi:hypothetical protein
MIELRAVLLGAASLLAGYVFWALGASALATAFGMSVPAGAWFVLSLCGAIGPIAAGYVGARIARSRKLLHGAIAALVGTTLILGALKVFAGVLDIYGVMAALLAAAVLSLVGAIFAVRKSVAVGP